MNFFKLYLMMLLLFVSAPPAVMAMNEGVHIAQKIDTIDPQGNRLKPEWREICVKNEIFDAQKEQVFKTAEVVARGKKWTTIYSCSHTVAGDDRFAYNFDAYEDNVTKNKDYIEVKKEVIAQNPEDFANVITAPNPDDRNTRVVRNNGTLDQYDKDCENWFVDLFTGSKKKAVGRGYSFIDLIATCAEAPDILLRNNADNNIRKNALRYALIASLVKECRPLLNVVGNIDMNYMLKFFKKFGCVLPSMFVVHAADAGISHLQLSSKKPLQGYGDFQCKAMMTLLVLEVLMRGVTVYTNDALNAVYADALNLMRLIIKRMPPSRAGKRPAVSKKQAIN